jgi:hypothetical protein
MGQHDVLSRVCWWKKDGELTSWDHSHDPLAVTDLEKGVTEDFCKTLGLLGHVSRCHAVVVYPQLRFTQ